MRHLFCGHSLNEVIYFIHLFKLQLITQSNGYNLSTLLKPIANWINTGNVLEYGPHPRPANPDAGWMLRAPISLVKYPGDSLLASLEPTLAINLNQPWQAALNKLCLTHINLITLCIYSSKF